MRFTRTEASERAFIEALERLHAAKKSMFTTHLMNSLDSFIPSRVDSALDVELFPELNMLQNVTRSSTAIDSPAKARVSTLLGKFVHLGPLRRDVFSLDNTNTIDGYSNTVKRRTPLKTATLLDIFNAVTFTEETALSANHPSSSRLPKPLEDCLSSVITREVLGMMSTKGVSAFLKCLVSSLNAILSDSPQSDDGPTALVQKHLVEERVIDTFKWMPNEWVLSLDEPETTQDVFVMNVDLR